MSARISRDEQIRRMIEKHDGFYTYENWGWPLATEPSMITCPIHGDFPQSYHNHKKGHGCPKCAHEKIWSGENGENRRAKLSSDEHRTRMSQATSEVWQRQEHRERMSKIHNSLEFKAKMSRISSENWINPEYRGKLDKAMTRNWQNPEFRERMSRIMSESTKQMWEDGRLREAIDLLWQDPDHREMMAKVLSSSSETPSIDVIRIASMLQYLNIKYQGGDDLDNEFTIPGTAYRFDFYLPDYGFFIEYHGKQHYEYVEFFHKTPKGFEKRRDSDAWKAQWAKDNGYGLLVIPYWDAENIEPILAEALGF